uniref:protein-tyrosine-phosphatase n=1 Tax=Knipowitschia caucasica TaxID=637954 RepID=A0AAV2KZU1_KNICA
MEEFQVLEDERPVDVTARPNTDSLNISWILPKGRVDQFEILLGQKSSQTTSSWILFTNLSPGQLFPVTVIAVAGELRASSKNATFATYPLPPEHINVLDRTNSSLDLSWAVHPRMLDAPNISYNITYWEDSGLPTGRASSVNNSTTLSFLHSGTQYDISVETVGPQDLLSENVTIRACTNPNPVLNLRASPETNTSVKVEWSYPQDNKPHYSYIILIHHNETKSVVRNQTVKDNFSSITELDPGTKYQFAVTIIFTPECQSTPEVFYSFTKPNAVSDLKVQTENTTFVKLIWLNQIQYGSPSLYLVQTYQESDLIYNDSTVAQSYTIPGLTPGEIYTFTVIVEVENVQSDVRSIKDHKMNPAAVTDLQVSGSTTNLTVSWTLADGRVDNYVAVLYNKTQQVQSEQNLSNNTSGTTFTELRPGLEYCVEVSAKRGSLKSNRTECNATFPNPPGEMNVSQTERSILFTWDTPEDMEADQYYFTVTTLIGTNFIQNNSFALEDLEPGSPYNISVATVGDYNYTSKKVTETAYTKPCAVTELRQTEITVDSVTLMWNQTDYKSDYSFLVEVSNISSKISSNISRDFTYTAEMLISGTNYSFSVTTLTADGTKASSETVSYFTRPYSVRALTANPNTTSIALTWDQPQQYKPEYTYVVITSSCVETHNCTKVREESIEVSDLTPGTNYSFCVTVTAADGTEGTPDCTTQYTYPAKAVVFFSEVSNCSMQNLRAGRNYTAVVKTHSGPYNVSSEPVTNSTLPNAPGAIDIESKTTGSINISWEEAPLMTGAEFHYLIEITPGEFNTTRETNYEFDGLMSGTSYNVSVTTVSALNFQSESVRRDMITTRPFSVKTLKSYPSEKSVKLSWVEPDQHKISYRFKVTALNSTGAVIQENTTQNPLYTFSSLDPGTSYRFNVTTETADGTEGASEETSNCTDASAVKSFSCKAPNDPNATITWFWEKPNGGVSSFSVQFGKDTTHEKCCSFTKGDLKHFTDYTATVTTQSCGKPSATLSKTCKTGITAPGIPENYKSMLSLKNVKYNEFTIVINPSLLNNSYGPIKYVGVLVTEKAKDVNQSDVAQYLENTYEQWKAKTVNVYLASVIETGEHARTRSTEKSLEIHVGDVTVWNNHYDNGRLEASKQYNFALVLFTNLTTRSNESVINADSSLYSYTNFDNVASLPPNPVIIGIAVGSTLGIFCVLFFILIGFIIYWRRLSSKESSDIQIHSLRAKVSSPVRVEDFEVYYKKQKADSNCGFASEYEDLKVVGTAQSKINALNPENKPKNRYNNVLPFDASRVKLSIMHGNPIDDYINANYIPGYNCRKEFIATQGPLPTTVDDFWRMIWEKNVHSVVMLTRCNEQGRVKCEQYWPPGTRHYGNITVTTISEIPLEDWTIRDFDIKNVKTAETRHVRHFHFTAWPDHGVPETTELLISFRHLVREHMDQYRHSPTVVHCSAGVGRTGTFIAIDRLIFQIERENVVDVYGIVHDMRMHRVLMVQTEDQFVFLNQCALDIIRSRTGNNVDLIYQNAAAFSIYENIELQKR